MTFPKKKKSKRTKKTPLVIGKLRIFDREKKRKQLRSNGNYPWVYAVRFLQYAPDKPLTWQQAQNVLHQISTDWHKDPDTKQHWSSTNQELIQNLAEKQIENMIRRMTHIEE